MQVLARIDRETLLAIGGHEFDACISIYMPVERTGSQTRKNAILFQDLCANARDKMKKYGVNDGLVTNLTEQLFALGRNPEFTEKRTDGIAIFAAPDGLWLYHAPVGFDAQAVVDKRFYIRPLIPLLERDNTLNLVLLNRKGARILRCSADSCTEKNPPHHLRSLENYMDLYEFGRTLQHQSNPAARPGGEASTTYHGQGTPGDDDAVKNRYLLDYYRHFKNWLVEEAGNPDTFYLVGDDRNTGMFGKAAGNSAHVFKTLIHKNIQALEDKEILQAVQAHMRTRTHDDNIAQNTRALEGEKKTEMIHSPSQIVAAAHDKRIETLFLPDNDNQLWGHFDKEKRKTMLEQDTQEAVGEELFNLAAIRTMQNGGDIVVQENGEDKSAAICRW